MPCGIAINSHGEMVVGEYGAHRVTVLDIDGNVILWNLRCPV